MKYFAKNKEEFHKLSVQLEADPIDKLALKEQISLLYKSFLHNFTGIITATPFAGCQSKFVRLYHADTKPAESEIWTSSKSSVLTTQLGPFVFGNKKDKVINPWEAQAKTTTIGRAVLQQDVVRSSLKVNHRAGGGLVRLPRDLFYHGRMQAAQRGPWSQELLAWHAFLRDMCPSLVMDENRLIVELQGAQCLKMGTSSYNPEHVKYACKVAKNALEHPALNLAHCQGQAVLIISMYAAQVQQYNKHLDFMVLTKEMDIAQRQQIAVRTVDGSQGHAADLVILDFVQTESPGFTAQRNRLCVSLTRARKAEVVLMSRGTFVGIKPDSNIEWPLGFDIRLLHHIYRHVAGKQAILTIDVTKDKKPVAVPDGTRCRNCHKDGHLQSTCTEPLKCSNCLKQGHHHFACSEPIEPRCSICNEKGHLRKDCTKCENCGAADHAKHDCTQPCTMTCNTCGKTGHFQKDCPDKPPYCFNCRTEGHTKHTCLICTICRTEGEHGTTRCPTNIVCRRCGIRGHAKATCPAHFCKFCKSTGHLQTACPKRVIEGEDGLTFGLVDPIVAPFAEVKTDDAPKKISRRKKAMMDANGLSTSDDVAGWGDNSQAEGGGGVDGGGQETGSAWGEDVKEKVGGHPENGGQVASSDWDSGHVDNAAASMW